MPHIGSPAALHAAVAERAPIPVCRERGGQRSTRWLSRRIRAAAVLTAWLGVAACTARVPPLPPLRSAVEAGEWQPESPSVTALAADGVLPDAVGQPEPPICSVPTNAPPSSYGELGTVGPFFLAATSRLTHSGRIAKLRIHAATDRRGATGVRSVRSRAPPPHASG